MVTSALASVRVSSRDGGGSCAVKDAGSIMWCHRRMTPRWPARGSSDGSDSDSDTVPSSSSSSSSSSSDSSSSDSSDSSAESGYSVGRFIGAKESTCCGLGAASGSSSICARTSVSAKVRPGGTPRVVSREDEASTTSRKDPQVVPPVFFFSDSFDSFDSFDSPFDSSDAPTLLRFPPAHIFATNSPLFNVARSARNWRSDAYVSGGKFRGCYQNTRVSLIAHTYDD